MANPGSDLDQFLRTFRDLYAILKDREDFSLDDISQALICRGNVSSQGAFGEEALRRSTRKDRSRDPIYNQSKMYSELYRTLGWLQSTTSALRFTFSWLGEHAAMTPDPKALTIECLLGMAYPNDVLGSQEGHSIRVFSTILRTANALGGTITRDEIIIGPLSISDDRDSEAMAEMLTRIKYCRSEPTGMSAALHDLQKRRGIKPTTMGNYTRFPIAAMQWAGWFSRVGAAKFKLTLDGSAQLNQILLLRDIRISDFRALPAEGKSAFLRLSAHLMLRRSGFDMSPATISMSADERHLDSLGISNKPELWFSPFQQVSKTEVDLAFPWRRNKSPAVEKTSKIELEAQGYFERTSQDATAYFVPTGLPRFVDSEMEVIERELKKDLEVARGSPTMAAEYFSRRHFKDNQDIFYPLVASLFRIVGFECRNSRRGVNYDRADAMIVHPQFSIPIEIKSPGEEREISVKAIRQAVENKVILLSRGQFNTTRGTTTLVVGFNFPNDRSEVHELIANIWEAFAFNVGVIDIRTLVCMALRSIQCDSGLNIDGFTKIRGLLNATDIFSN